MKDKKVKIILDAKLLDKAKKLGINIPQTTAEFLHDQKQKFS